MFEHLLKALCWNILQSIAICYRILILFVSNFRNSSSSFDFKDDFIFWYGFHIIYHLTKGVYFLHWFYSQKEHYVNITAQYMKIYEFVIFFYSVCRVKMIQSVFVVSIDTFFEFYFLHVICVYTNIVKLFDNSGMTSRARDVAH